MALIKQIKARQILDSRGNPTVEVDVITDSGLMARAAVPSGASTGTLEALELRDKDQSKYLGKSVTKAVNNVNTVLHSALKGHELYDQRGIDQRMLELDGTKAKSNLGANAILGVSMAVARAAAMSKGIPLYVYLREHLHLANKAGSYKFPLPLMNVINGGAHAQNNLEIQEFMIVPMLQGPFSENLRAGVEVFHHLKSLLQKDGHSTNVGDEGGFAPSLENNRHALDYLVAAIKAAGLTPGKEMMISLDCAANEFQKENGNYILDDKEVTALQLIEYYEQLIANYPIYSIEDGLSESDKDNWQSMTQKLGSKIKLIGDDLFVTNKEIFAEGIGRGLANAILIKLNQIGTLSETMDTISLAFDSNYDAVISHRSGETSDSFIADLAVACGCGHIKTGSASRTDRTEKYNQLLRIEEDLHP